MVAFRQFATKQEMADSLGRGRGLVQQQHQHPDEIKWLDELIAEGKAEVVDDWKIKDFQQAYKRRTVKGVAQAGTRTRDVEGRYA